MTSETDKELLLRVADSMNAYLSADRDGQYVPSEFVFSDAEARTISRVLREAAHAMLAAPPVSPPTDHSEDALDMVKAPPAESGGVDDAWREAGEKQLQVHEALRDSAYRAGARAGWNAQFAADPDAAIEQLTRYPKGALAVIHEKHAREKCAFHTPAPQPGGAVKQRVLERISVFASYSPEEGESWESWYHSAFDLLASEVAALEPSPSQWNAGAEATKTRARPLDLATMFKHAWIAGKTGVAWEDYDPTELIVYQRLAETLDIPLPTPPAGEG